MIKAPKKKPTNGEELFVFLPCVDATAPQFPPSPRSAGSSG